MLIYSVLIIAEVLAVNVSDSVIDQQNDANTKSMDDKEIDNFIPEEPANVPDSVIAQLNQCKPPQIENFDYYGITDETSCGVSRETICPLCSLDHDDDDSIEGRYKAGSYFIKCEQREIEIVA